MNATTTLFGPKFAEMIIKAKEDGEKTGARMYWDILMSILSKHLTSILIFLAIILIVAIIEAARGRWGMLGKVLYNYLYFGILFIVGSIFGPEIFVSSWFSIACTAALYPFCYWLVGIILTKLGLIKRGYFPHRSYRRR